MRLRDARARGKTNQEMMTRTTTNAVAGRSVAMRRMRRRSHTATQPYCSTNGCTSFLVVDPTTGNMHVFTENDSRIEGGKVIMPHHSSPLSGNAVAGAGIVKFDDGQIDSGFSA